MKHEVCKKFNSCVFQEATITVSISVNPNITIESPHSFRLHGVRLTIGESHAKPINRFSSHTSIFCITYLDKNCKNLIVTVFLRTGKNRKNLFV